jgi:hypothetical protein
LAHNCVLFKAYPGELARKSIGDRSERPCYLSRNNLDLKIRARKQRTDMGKYCSVNKTIKLWNQLPKEALATFPCQSHIFRRKFKKLIISEERSGIFEAWRRNVQKCRKVKNVD